MVGRVLLVHRGPGRELFQELKQYLLEAWGLHGILLHLHHANDSLLGSGVERHSLLWRCVPEPKHNSRDVSGLQKSIWSPLGLLHMSLYKQNTRQSELRWTTSDGALFKFKYHSMHFRFPKGIYMMIWGSMRDSTMVYLIYWAGACLSAARTGIAAAIFCETCLSRAARVLSVSYRRGWQRAKTEHKLVVPK